MNLGCNNDDNYKMPEELLITPTEFHQTYYLDHDKKCWITVYIDSFFDGINFDELHSYKVEGMNTIIGKHSGEKRNLDAHRTFLSLGIIPKCYDHPDKLTYMYNDLNNVETDRSIDSVQPVKKIIDHFGGKYNQAIVNWYDNGEEYIPFHKDCEEQIPDNKDIAIVTLTPLFSENHRELSFICDNTKMNQDDITPTYDKINITTLYGCVCVIGGETNTYFRHGSRKKVTSDPRISISLRTITQL